jgi:hypothetical protein
LNEIWFELYKRETKNDSSGFEHVFLGENRRGETTGFHNWIQFWSQEQLGKVDYKGWLKNKNTQKHPVFSFTYYSIILTFFIISLVTMTEF